MELNKFLNLNIDSFKKKINTILNFKILLYLVYVIILSIIISYFKINIIISLFIIILIYQIINHISIVLSHALWSSGKTG